MRGLMRLERLAQVRWDCSMVVCFPGSLSPLKIFPPVYYYYCSSSHWTPHHLSRSNDTSVARFEPKPILQSPIPATPSPRPRSKPSPLPSPRPRRTTYPTQPNTPNAQPDGPTAPPTPSTPLFFPLLSPHHQ